MSDHAGLLRAIEEAPYDDSPRLILADWYEDHGDPERAQLIRLQVSRAARESGGEAWRRYFGWLHPDHHDSGWKEFVRECCRDDEGNLRLPMAPEPHEVELLQRRRDHWLPGLPLEVTFDRGMPERVELTAWDYLKYAGDICRHTPVLSVGLTAYAPWDDEDCNALGYPDYETAREEIVGRLAEHPSLSRWVELDFIGCPGWDNYMEILRSPHLLSPAWEKTTIDIRGR
jgi:uncharacterized protein (TIGR02996 family)